jgi:hypothetical protein
VVTLLISVVLESFFLVNKIDYGALWLTVLHTGYQFGKDGSAAEGIYRYKFLFLRLVSHDQKTVLP